MLPLLQADAAGSMARRWPKPRPCRWPKPRPCWLPSLGQPVSSMGTVPPRPPLSLYLSLQPLLCHVHVPSTRMWGYLGLMLQYFSTFSHGRWDGWLWTTQRWRACTAPSPARHPASAMDVPRHLHKTFWVTLRDLGIAQGCKCCSAASAPSPGRAAERGSELHAAPELEAVRGGEATASCEKSCRRQAALGAASSLLETEPYSQWAFVHLPLYPLCLAASG